MATKGFYLGGIQGAGPNLNFSDDQLSPAKGASIWQRTPQLSILLDPAVGYEFYDDFIGLVTGTSAWVTTQATSGTAAAGTLAGGTVALNAGAATANQGIQMQRAGAHFFAAAGKHMWYEVRLKTSQLNGQFFFGLADTDTTLVATGAIHATDHISFSSLTNDGVVLFKTSAASSVTNGGAATTLVATTYVRLGFEVSGNTSVTPYVNGVAGTPITTNIPSAGLTPSFVCQAAGAGTPQVDVDYISVQQLR